MSTIESAVISYAKGMFDFEFGLNGSAKAELVFADGSTDTFWWYHDEVTFTESDFVGHTMDEVRETFRRRDMAWLRS